MSVTARVGLRCAVVAALAAAGVWLLAAVAAGQQAPPEAAGRVAFLARADNPVDALAASSVAGQLGGIVLLTGSDVLGEDAAGGLEVFGPDLVVLAGGTAALSEQVEADVTAAGFAVRRVAGESRTSTAAALGALVGEFASPFALDSDVDGLRGQVEELTGRVAAAEAAAEALAGRVAAAEGRVGALEALLAGVSRSEGVLRFSGMNLQVVNGTGGTGSANGLGNLVVGYNEDATTSDCQFGDAANCDSGDGAADTRTGSHTLVVGPDHSYTGFGGIVAGLNNTTGGRYASVIGGQVNTASGASSAVTGGSGNTAGGFASAVTGGSGNTASGPAASVAGGASNTAGGDSTSVTGGQFNEADGPFAAVTGGSGNTASGPVAAVTGGASNTASGFFAAVTGGQANTASGSTASVTGGSENTASGFATSVAGGRSGTVNDDYDSLIGNDPKPDA